MLFDSLRICICVFFPYHVILTFVCSCKLLLPLSFSFVNLSNIESSYLSLSLCIQYAVNLIRVIDSITIAFRYSIRLQITMKSHIYTYSHPLQLFHMNTCQILTNKLVETESLLLIVCVYFYPYQLHRAYHSFSLSCSRVCLCLWRLLLVVA